MDQLGLWLALQEDCDDEQVIKVSRQLYEKLKSYAKACDEQVRCLGYLLIKNIDIEVREDRINEIRDWLDLIEKNKVCSKKALNLGLLGKFPFLERVSPCVEDPDLIDLIVHTIDNVEEALSGPIKRFA